MPGLVVTEVAHLLESRLGPDAEVRFLGHFAAGNLVAQPVAAPDWLRIAELVATDRDLPLGTVDESIVAVAERQQLPSVATPDRRHFSAVRPPRVPALDVLP